MYLILLLISNKMKQSPDFYNFLNEKVLIYNAKSFIATDPISIPRQFSKKEDIEISGFLTALISWGQRPVILTNANKMMQLMEFAPYDFIASAKAAEFKKLKPFVHRTMNGEDLIVIVKGLQHIYKNEGGMEALFSRLMQKHSNETALAISEFRATLFKGSSSRAMKHFGDPLKNSASKRMNMFLRWMVRKDKCGVDFGIWKSVKPEYLYCPLDLHSGNVSRKLGLLRRPSDDWKAVVELTESLRKMDPVDPVKYDFALFGLGVFEKF